MPVLTESIKGVRGGMDLHILGNKTFVKHQNKKNFTWLSQLGDNKVV